MLPAAVAIYSQSKQNQDRIQDRQHEVVLLDARHTHERAQGIRDDATRAYAFILRAVEQMRPALFDTVGDDSDSIHALVDKLDDAYGLAYSGLSTLRLHGWSPEIRELAKETRKGLTEAYEDYYRHWMVVNPDPSESEETRAADINASEEPLNEKRRQVTLLAERLADALGD